VGLTTDGSAPAAAVGATATTATATSGTIPALSLVGAFVMADANSGATGEQCTVTSTGGLSWSLAARHNGSPGADVELWTAPAVSSPGTIVISVTDNQGAVDKRIYPVVWTDPNGIPAGIGAISSGANATQGYVSTVPGSWGWSVGLGGGGTPVPGAGQTLKDSDTAFDGGDGTWVISQNATTTSAGTTVNMSVTAPATVLHHLAVEVLPAGTVVPARPIVVPSLAVMRAANW
jgi:hypothetical protein